ncbi:MAG: ABC transporter ATP-binding protein/permease [Acholeplasmatales bacterium]|nr:ABC transporter ATP-binding protein/permease [Acholeplasmatales bacterium]
MLKLKGIKKNYYVADMTVEALKGIDLCFRKNEFVSILGPSGCGKTTLLNIIGGLDKYTSGDLFINGKSTKEYGDREWDVYRNHRIGFIFQSYNLIPHQTVLGNVELALTISGISKAERIERAKKALDRVGLSNQYYKKPNQLSGGQCQRVAIARALVNEPEILLADEPTGALDTETSVQIMDLIKEIANERLVIMVTHNPELAEKYSNRIVRFLDGLIIEDSNPFTEEEEAIEIEKSKDKSALVDSGKVKEKAKMSMWTAFKLSLRNLLTKRARTLLTCFAGAIGIIGVSSVLSVSTGVKDYIASMQDDLLSGNPITIEKTGVDMTSLMNESSLQDKREILEAGDYVNVNGMIQYLIGNQDVLLNLQYNNEFNKEYVNYLKSMPDEYYQSITLDYGIDVTKNIYTDFRVSDDPLHKGYGLNKNISLDAITETYTSAIEHMDDYSKYAEMITSLTTVMSQCIPDNDYIKSQYDIVDGELPKNKEDVLIVLDSENMLTDLLLVQLGYYNQDDFFKLVRKALGEDMTNYMTDEEYVSLRKFEYSQLREKKFTWYSNDLVYDKKISYMPDGEGNIVPIESFTYDYDSTKFVKEGETEVDIESNKLDLNICGIVKPKEGISYGALRTGFLYSEALARYMISINKDSEIVKNINDSETKAIYSGITNVGGTEIPIGISYNLDYYWEFGWQGDGMESAVASKQIFVGKKNAISQIMGFFGISTGSDLVSLDARSVAGDYLPSSIAIYPNDFENKDLVTDYLDKWNSMEDVTFYDFDENFTPTDKTITLAATNEARREIKYIDSVELIINMINTMINIITYALVAFTCLSLVVSCVMIAIITYVSVMERIKEIGVIRSLGGRKKDVSHLFNAETFIIGLSSGIIGIGVTGILSIIANVIVNALSDGAVPVIAHLTVPTAIIMVLISILLTCISGLVPARSAAKKDPVVALRTE